MVQLKFWNYCLSMAIIAAGIAVFEQYNVGWSSATDPSQVTAADRVASFMPGDSTADGCCADAYTPAVFNVTRIVTQKNAAACGCVEACDCIDGQKCKSLTCAFLPPEGKATERTFKTTAATNAGPNDMADDAAGDSKTCNADGGNCRAAGGACGTRSAGPARRALFAPRRLLGRFRGRCGRGGC